jgi:predicted MFS family arabinose efflux permease
MPRVSQQAGFWVVACSFFVVTAFSTAPSSLYGLFAKELSLSPLTVTVVYAVYAVGLVGSLLLAGHLSDVHGRRTVLLPAIGLAIGAALPFLVWRTLPGLLVARLLTGAAIGAAVATATAYITDLDGGPGRRAPIVGTVANIGGLAFGPLIAGCLARYAPHPLTLPFDVFVVALGIAFVALIAVPEGHPGMWPRPRYRPQRLKVPAHAREQFVAALAGTFLCFAVFGLFAGLAGRFLVEPLGHPSPALTGLAIFLTFAAGITVQVTTITVPAQRLIARGLAPALAGLAILVLCAWTSPPSLTLFLIGGLVAGAGGGAIFRGSLSVVIETSRQDERAGALTTFFVAGYAGISLPVLGLGVALEVLSARVTLLVFGLGVGLGLLLAAPLLIRRPDQTSERHGDASST